MPNKCARCGKIHPDDADYLLKGCDECGSKFFFYVRNEVMGSVDVEIDKLTPKEVEEIEKDIRDIIEPERIERDETVVLDLEAIRVVRPGKYMIDVANLFTQKPIVIRAGPGKYELDLSVLLSRLKKKPRF
ncbi:Zn-ribbon domain-containing protein [Candidatus Aenigmatarchaeota archaeon]